MKNGLPFTVEQFFAVFKLYNQTVYPIQILFYLLAATVIFLSIRKSPNANRIINAILSFFWLWMGIVYHLIYFTSINSAAYLFGGMFIVQGLLFLYHGVLKDNLPYCFRTDKRGWIGAVLVVFALIIYPILNYLFGHQYPASPTFGLPCPTTIFTIGILMWSEKRLPLYLLIIPFIWSIIGFSAALILGVVEDTSLLIAGLLGLILIRSTALFNKANQDLSTK